MEEVINQIAVERDCVFFIKDNVTPNHTSFSDKSHKRETQTQTHELELHLFMEFVAILKVTILLTH